MTRAPDNLVLFRHVLVLDNLEERQFYGIPAGVSLNLPHFRIAVKTIAKIHAVGICHKLMLFHTFQQQESAALSKKTCEDVELDGNYRISIEKVQSTFWATSGHNNSEKCLKIPDKYLMQ